MSIKMNISDVIEVINYFETQKKELDITADAKNVAQDLDAEFWIRGCGVGLCIDVLKSLVGRIIKESEESNLN